MKQPPIPSIGFLGAGKMATALARGWIKARLTKPENLLAGDPFADARTAFTKATRIKTLESNQEVVAHSQVVVLAVKPQQAADVLREVAPHLRDDQLLISVVAGVSISQINEAVGHEQRIIRVMPNTPCLVRASASAYSPSLTARDEDVALVDRLLNAVGRAYQVPEKLLDAVTGLSGSGPAYVFLMVEALSDGGVRMGLPRDVATALSAQTVLGAAKMLLESGKHLGVLKEMVTSPGGTTMAGLHELERAGVRGALMNAVEAATRRAAELGRMNDEGRTT